MTDRGDTKLVKQLLQDRIQGVCHWLLPDGRRVGSNWRCNNPKLDAPGQTPEMRVYFSGVVGSWKDFRSGDKGDVVRLIEYIHDTDFVGAMRLAKDFLGLGRLSADERRKFEDAAAKRQEVAAKKAKKKEDRKRMHCEKRFLEAALFGAGSPAEVHARRYWSETRGIDIGRVENLDRTSFRFSPSVEYWRMSEYRPDPETGRLTKVKEGPRFPAILCAMRSVLGQFVDHHVTFLDHVRADKVDLGPKQNPRLMACPNAGSVIRISHGPEGKLPEHSEEPHPLILAEGVETALSLALALPECRVWACGSISGIKNAPVTFPFVSEIYVAGENDWDKPQARKSLEAALDALEQSGKPLELMRSHVGSDFNDLMKEDQ